eukprot:2868584-Amphidinium_carterae.1
MTEYYRDTRIGMKDRIDAMYDHVNYGRGIPVLVTGLQLTSEMSAMLGTNVTSMERDVWNKINSAAIRGLGVQDMCLKYQQHIEEMLLWLAKVENQVDRASGVHVEARIPEPTIVLQTNRQVPVTMVPGPAW